MTRTVVAIGMIAAAACFARPASADGTPGDAKKEVITPEAEAAFTEGRKLFDERKFTEACERLAESQRLSPSVKALGLLAACHEEQGKLVLAYSEYVDAAERARRLGDSRESFARSRATALRGTLPVLHIEVTKPYPGLVITQNGSAIPSNALQETYVDPGPVEIVALAPGRKAWKTQVTAAASARMNITVPELASDTAEPAPLQGPLPPPKPVTPPRPAGTPATRVAGFITGAVGLAGLGVGSAFGLIAIKQNNASKRDGMCNDQNFCTPEGAEDRNKARTSAAVSTVLFSVGGAAVVSSAVLLILSASPKDSGRRAAASSPLHVAVSGDPRGAGLTVSGSF